MKHRVMGDHRDFWCFFDVFMKLKTLENLNAATEGLHQNLTLLWQCWSVTTVHSFIHSFIHPFTVWGHVWCGAWVKARGQAM